MIETVFNWESLIAEYSQMYKSIISSMHKIQKDCQ